MDKRYVEGGLDGGVTDMRSVKRRFRFGMEMGGRGGVGKPPTPPPLLNGLGAGYPTVAPSSEIYAESWVNRPGQSAL